MRCFADWKGITILPDCRESTGTLAAKKGCQNAGDQSEDVGIKECYGGVKLCKTYSILLFAVPPKGERNGELHVLADLSGFAAYSVSG